MFLTYRKISLLQFPPSSQRSAPIARTQPFGHGCVGVARLKVLEHIRHHGKRLRRNFELEAARTGGCAPR